LTQSTAAREPPTRQVSGLWSGESSSNSCGFTLPTIVLCWPTRRWRRRLERPRSFRARSGPATTASWSSTVPSDGANQLHGDCVAPV